MLNRASMVVAAALVACMSAGVLLAENVSVTFWKGGITSQERDVSVESGELAGWKWSQGVVLITNDASGEKRTTIPRADVIFARRDSSDGFNRALADGEASLEAFIKSEDVASAYEREEGWYMLAMRRETLAAYNTYISTYPDGNFIAEVRLALADYHVRQGDEEAAIEQYEEAMDLGQLPRIDANIAIGEYYLGQDKVSDAQRYFDNADARSAAQAVRMPIRSMKLFANAGECARLSGDKAKARDRFKEVLAVDTKWGSDADSLGKAHFGLGATLSDAEERFDHYLKAAYWYEGSTREAEALLGAIAIADENKKPDPKDPWAKKSQATRNAMQKYYPSELNAYDKGSDDE